ncbi:tetratricopeptide repeat protein [Allonocardiopsis opalescens]|uniref:Tetratricopeptide repeat protein n=1 Tax=Allonocardiopsis opalescens TaxID=1144618 RepID=A0A2T0Q7V7_9ACTN|nr:tetratricopeptide repeat protein [Allonocardiopsis opalescens]PRX99896.1 tetratricopeptide repeat protein [Allonocardiopsis opalescens]
MRSGPPEVRRGGRGFLQRLRTRRIWAGTAAVVVFLSAIVVELGALPWIGTLGGWGLGMVIGTGVLFAFLAAFTDPIPRDRSASFERTLVPRQLPKDSEGLVGRRAELATLAAHFQRFPRPAMRAPMANLARWFRRLARGGRPNGPLVVAVYGPGGTGKTAIATRLAHQVADRFPDGQLYVNLRGAGGQHGRRPQTVINDFLQAFGARPPTDLGGLEALARLWRTHTFGRRLLIFLDNAKDEAQVRALLPNGSRCAVIVTSRQELALGAAETVHLSGLEPDDGLRLLAHLAGPERIDAEPEAARAILRVCGDLPLAISVCGGLLHRNQDWRASFLAMKLSEDLGPVLDGVRASVMVSYDARTEQEKRLLQFLSFLDVDSFPEWIGVPLLPCEPRESRQLLERLARQSLVETVAVDGTDTLRYRLHDLVRAVLLDLWQESTPRLARPSWWPRLPWQGDATVERRAALVRVIDLYARLARRAAAARWPQDWATGSPPGMGRTDEPAPPLGRDNAGARPALWLAAERRTLLFCLDQAEDLGEWGLCWQISRALASLCHSLRSYWTDWDAATEAGLRAAGQVGSPLARAIAQLDRAALLNGRGDYQESGRLGELARRTFLAERHPLWAARALRTIGMNKRLLGDLDDGRTELARAIEEFERAGDPWWRARTLRNLAEVYEFEQDYARAGELLEEALAVFRAGNNRYSEAQTLRALGEVHSAQGDHDRGAERIEAAMDLFLERDERWDLARCLRAKGEMNRPGAADDEWDSLDAAEKLLERLGDQWGVARTRWAKARALARRDRSAEAGREFRRCARTFAELGDNWWCARSRRAEAETYIEAGRYTDALLPARAALEVYQGLDNTAGTARAHYVLGMALLGAGELLQAPEQARAALDLYRRLGNEAGVRRARALLDEASGSDSGRDGRAGT